MGIMAYITYFAIGGLVVIIIKLATRIINCFYPEADWPEMGDFGVVLMAIAYPYLLILLAIYIAYLIVSKITFSAISLIDRVRKLTERE